MAFKDKLKYYRAAVLILLWDILMYTHINFLRYFSATELGELTGLNGKKKNKIIEYVLVAFYCFFFLSFPLFGLLADVWIGRYKVITIGITMSFISVITGGIGYVLSVYIEDYIIFLVLYGFAYLLEIGGYAAIRANIMQYNIDQLIGASADQLSNLMQWHCISLPISFTLLQLGRCVIDHRCFLVTSFIISGIAVSFVLVTHSLFKHWLEKPSLIGNPIKLIVRVLNYARKHKYPENRSALTYWEKEVPSRLDLGKEKYGGPFSEEEVEDVKTVIRMIPLFIAVVSTCAEDLYFSIMYGYLPKSCFISSNFSKFVTALCLFIIYQFVFNLLIFYKWIPSMLKRIGIGLAFSASAVVSKVIIFALLQNHHQSSSGHHMYPSDLLVIPQVLHGISFFFTFPTSFEFIIAQSPAKMRGVMVGMWFGFAGIGTVINIGIKYPFGCGNKFICTNFYYYVVISLIMIFILIVFVLLAKRYKFRVRENEVNIHQIVDDHYQRYMEQEEKHNNHS